MALNPQQQLFADYYLVDPNATESAKKAGYSEKTAYSQGQRLLKHVEVRAYIDAKLSERSHKLNIEAEWVLAKLVQVADRTMKAEPVMKWDYEQKELVETGEYAFDSQGANRALELIGKHLGMFKDKLEVVTEQRIVVNRKKVSSDA